MGRKLNWIGGVLTAIYIVFMLAIVIFRVGELRDLKLNELGDFLAGAFGPVAFFWLVLGFLQQGEELRQGTEALRLQAVELRNSVEQQSIMANAATEQIKAQQTALQLQLAERDRQYQPDFTFTTGARMMNSSGEVETSITIRNTGKEVRDLIFVFDPAIGDESGCEFEVLRTGSGLGFDFQFQCPKDLLRGALSISYVRLDGAKWIEVFDYSIKPDEPFVRVIRPLGGTPKPLV